jgi:hypothetical protein
MLTGPGNSQPHKVTACGKPNNKSGGVDVHAAKSFSSAACTSTQATTQAQVAAAAATQAGAAVQATAPTTQVTATPSTQVTATPSTQVTATPSTQVTAGAAPSQHAGGVLATHTTVGKAKHAPKHGVLGEVTNVAGSTLPFTGFPLWGAVAAGLALIAAGLLVRRRAGGVSS